MQKTLFLDNIFLYEGHKVKVFLKDNTAIEDELEKYDEEGIFLSKSGKRPAFSEIEDLLYCGELTSYDTTTKEGIVDGSFHFFKDDFKYSNMEKEYTVYCHLAMKETALSNSEGDMTALEIYAADAKIEEVKKTILDADFLRSEECFYFLKNNENKVGTIVGNKDGYKLKDRDGIMSDICPSDICDIHRVLKKNDYVTVGLKNEKVAGLVIFTGPASCVLLAEKNIRKTISYNEIKEIRYYGMVNTIRENSDYVKTVLKLYGNKEYVALAQTSDLKNETIVSFCMRVDSMERPQGFEASSVEVLSLPEAEKPVETMVPVLVRRYEENSEERGFWVILQSDYEEDRVEPNAEFFVYADEKITQSNILKDKDYSVHDYPALIDVYVPDNGKQYGVFCSKVKINNHKGCDKKFWAASFKYSKETKSGFAIYDGHGKGRFFHRDRTKMEWNGEYKDFDQYLSTLQRSNKDEQKMNVYKYHVVYTLKASSNKKFEYEVKTMRFLEKGDAGVEMQEILDEVSFEAFRTILAEKYSEVPAELTSEYAFGFLNNYFTGNDMVRLFSGYKVGYKKNGEETDAIELLKSNLVYDEEIDTNYASYLVAYPKNMKDNRVSDDKKCYVVAKYNFNYSPRFAVKITESVQLAENGVKILTIIKKMEDIDKQMKAFNESIKAYQDEITDVAPKMVSYENCLLKTEQGYELKEGKEMEDTQAEVYRFGLLTGIDPKQEYGYIDYRLRFAFETLSVPAFNCYAQYKRKNVVVCYCCDENGMVKRVIFPTKEMISCIKWDARNSKVETCDIRGKEQNTAKITMQSMGHTETAVYYFAGEGDAVIHKLAQDGKLEKEFVFVKTVLGHCWDKDELRSQQKNMLPCYVVAINMQVEELAIASENGRWVARRNDNTSFPINGVVNETISNSTKRLLQLKIDETGYGLEVNKNTDESSEEFLKKNPYEKAAQGEAIQWDGQEENSTDDINNNGVYFKREEEETIWKVIADSDRRIQKSGTAVILYGQKRCGKTSLVNKVISDIEMNSKNEEGLKPIIIQRNNIKDTLEISKDSTPKDSAEKVYRDILREVMDNKDAVIALNEEKKKHKDVLQRSQKDELEKYDWTSIFKAILVKLKNPVIVVMDEFTDVCESVLAKYEGDWKQTELAKKEFDFISVLKECGIIVIIIGHENMHTALNELRLTNAISAKADPIELTCFSDPSAEGLIRIPIRNVIGYYDPYGDIQGDSENDAIGKKAVKRMMYMTGKNPNILMKLCDLMYKHYGDKKNYIRYSLEKKIMSEDIVNEVIGDWMDKLASDKADTLFDMILREPADDWFFNDNGIYQFVFAGCKATESLAYIYLECAAKRFLECGVCMQEELYADAFEAIQKQMENKYAFIMKHARRNKSIAQNAEIYNQLSEEEKRELIQEMIVRMETKLANRRVININNGNVEIVMQLFVEYVKGHKM